MDQALQHDLDKLFVWYWVLLIVDMGIYACKRLIFAPTCTKYNPIILNKCVQHCQLHASNTLDGLIVLTMREINYFYGSCTTSAHYK